MPRIRSAGSTATALSTVARQQANSIAYLGDSIANAQATQVSTSTSVYTLGWSFGHWLNIFLRQRFHVVGVYGYSGQGTPQLVGHVQEALAANPRFLFLEGGINSIQGGATAASIIADFQTIYAAAAAKGTTVLHGTIMPCGNLLSTPNTAAAKQAEIDKVNAWIMAEGARTPGVIVVPWHAAIADPATGLPLANTTQDGTHPRILGAQRLARFAANILAPLIPDVGHQLPASNAEVTNAVGNGLMVGTGGSSRPMPTGPTPPCCRYSSETPLRTTRPAHWPVPTAMTSST